jgi:glucosamine--fructose-6-phosphate aminotransferase (isomerizing)
MCRIIGAVSERNVTPILVEGLKRLEYRGYDSAGVAVINNGKIERVRRVGKVEELERALQKKPLTSHIGIAHTRWATHGQPSEANAHPHISGANLALVHNGIIENYVELKEALMTRGYQFSSETDTEVIVHMLHELLQKHQLLDAVQEMVKQLRGAYALAIIDSQQSDRLIAVRHGSPLIIGMGIGEHFIASDHLALLPVTQKFIFLEDGDFADVRCDSLTLYNQLSEVVERPITISTLSEQQADKGTYRHYMLKEIYEQPIAINKTLEGCLLGDIVQPDLFGAQASEIFAKVERIQIIACGTSYHSGLVARYWLEHLANIPCQVEIASEYRYRTSITEVNTLFITLSQSGETADTLSALRKAKQEGILASLAICNVPESSLVRESDLSFITKAGPEVGVASTKAFTTQLTVLLLFTAMFAEIKATGHSQEIISALRKLATQVTAALNLDKEIATLSEFFAHKEHTFF